LELWSKEGTRIIDDKIAQAKKEKLDDKCKKKRLGRAAQKG